jgi:tetratricopeptide (TPR) repeat protein
LYTQLGYFKKAIDVSKNVIDLYFETYGNKNPIYLNSLSTLASVYIWLGDYQMSLEINQKVVESTKEVLGETHPSYLFALNDLAFNYFYLDKSDLALNHFGQSLYLKQKRIVAFFSQLNEYERDQFWKVNSKYFNFLSLFVERVKYDQSKYISLVYDIALFTKGLLLNTTIDFENLIAEKGTPEAIEKFKDLKLLKLQIQKLHEKPIAARYLNVDSLETVAQKLETELVKLSKEYGDYTQNLKITWKDVQLQLGEKDVAIEFLEYPTLTDTVKYAALVLRKGWENPKFVPLFRKNQIDEFVKRDPNQIYSKGFVGKEIRNLDRKSTRLNSSHTAH